MKKGLRFWRNPLIFNVRESGLEPETNRLKVYCSTN